MRAANYESLVRRLYSLERRGMRLSLDGTRSFLKKLGNPERHCASVVVGGTNGKGSTCSFISSILTSAGYTVGLYTSPHLLDFRERIRVSGRCMSREHARELLRRVVPAGERGGYSFFETMTAAALRYFRDQKVDVVVAEVGLGGRLDSTNVLSPLVSVITGISIEHRHILGPTLAAIAGEKAGIMRKGRPVVTAAGGMALRALEEKARAKRARLVRVGSDLSLRTLLVSRAGNVFSVVAGPNAGRHYFTGLRGRFQVKNAGSAILTSWCMGKQGFPSTEVALEEGLRRARWPGRLEEWGTNPVFLFDVAHNPEAASNLRDALRTLYPGRGVVAVVGMVQDKDHGGFLRRFAPFTRHVVLTQPSCERAIPAERLRQSMPPGAASCSVVPNLAQALEAAISKVRKDELVCVTGSFYTVGEAMDCLGIGVAESV